MSDDEKKCIFWSDNSCYWYRLDMKYMREELIVGAWKFEECIDGTGKYTPTLNTDKRCRFFKKVG